ncbi:UPF0738 family protein [Paenisporosarcina antarctica]|uniref:Uncharacterized protein n=1 Tax=Paenisporosarcina antarctica TaxID=417367 RepID=A0A4P7A1C5_9BACL|nr:hypothetical protein [Paenisporosarcina antarctica]QBP41696.1 hypothetical protein E2636_11320 [Paenisporosarcina antarctica]
MRKTYTVISGIQNGSNIRFILEEDPTGQEVKAGGQLITDSDKNAFVYLMDDTDGYIYVQFPKMVWPFLATSLAADKEPVLAWGQTEISLDNFRAELNMLIFNIEGNHNYGEEFANSVEDAFKEQLLAQ